MNTIVHFKINNEFKSVTIDSRSSSLQTGEEFVWSLTHQKGIFTKHATRLFGITNYRILQYDLENSILEGLLMMSNLEDIVVMNTHREYNSQHVGTYGSFARGFGTSSGHSTGRSISVGDIVFMSEGKPIIRWQGISDPNGLKKLVTAIKKELYPKKELEKFLSGITNDGLTYSRDKSFCLDCGAKNPESSSFCNKCGHVLR